MLLLFKRRLSSEVVVRKLGNYEIILNDACSKGYLQVLYTVLIDSQIDLYSHLDSVTRSVQLWKSLHPYFSCQIVNNDTFDHVKGRVNFDRHFAVAKNRHSLSNVHYLDHVGSRDDYKVWVKLNDLFLNSPIPAHGEFLWRLVFIRLRLNRYCIAFNWNHELGGGKTGHCIIRQFFSIMDAMLKRQEVPSEFTHVQEVPKSLETMLYNDDQRLIDDIRVPEKDIELNNRLFRVPETILEKDRSKLVFKMNGKLLNHVDQTESSFYKGPMGFYLKGDKFSLSKEETKRFLSYCKRQGSKPTGCFATIISLALHKAFKKFQVSQTEIVYAVSVNLNQFLTKELHRDQMGYYGTRAVHSIDCSELVKALDERDGIKMNQLWLVSKTETEKNQKAITEKRIFEYPKLKKRDLERLSKTSVVDENAFKVHFILSNIGSIERFPGEIGGFKILDMYMETTLPKHGVSSHLFIAYLIITNDELHVAFELNTTISSQFTEILTRTVKDIVCEIIQK